jgi:taurine dioxygenase
MRDSRVDISPIAGALGAEAGGVDVAQDLDDAVICEIRQALLDYSVIFFGDQNLDIDRQKAFTRRFGEIFIHPNYNGVSADPEIIDVRREPGDKRIVDEDWHTGITMVAEPPMGAILYAIEVPPYGGDTLFANQHLAYESLSPGLKRSLDGSRAVHTDRMVAGSQAGMNAHRSTKVREDADRRETISIRPVLRTHPETDRKLPFVNCCYTVGFEGWTEAESRPLLGYLMEQGHRPEFTCRFRWANGSIAFWDNRSTKHLAAHDAGPFRRITRRTQICGDRV